MGTRRFFTRAEVSDDLRSVHRRVAAAPTTSTETGGATTRVVQGVRSPWRELHPHCCVEGLRQGRDHHLGDSADQLSSGWSRTRPIRAARLRRRVLVHPSRDAGVPIPTFAASCFRMYREAKNQHGGDPVLAWAHIVKGQPGAREGVQVRLAGPAQDEAAKIVAARRTCTIGGEVPTGSRASRRSPRHVRMSSRTRQRVRESDRRLDAELLRLVRQPPSPSPAGVGDDERPESANWWNAGCFLIMWGSNLPVARTPDARWMTEAPFRGRDGCGPTTPKDDVKFADEWLPCQAGHRRCARHGDGSRDPQGVL